MVSLVAPSELDFVPGPQDGFELMFWVLTTYYQESLQISTRLITSAGSLTSFMVAYLSPNLSESACSWHTKVITLVLGLPKDRYQTRRNSNGLDVL